MSLCHLRARFARGTAPSHETRPAPEVPGETEPCALGGSAPSLLPDVNGAEAGQGCSHSAEREPSGVQNLGALHQKNSEGTLCCFIGSVKKHRGLCLWLFQTLFFLNARYSPTRLSFLGTERSK